MPASFPLDSVMGYLKLICLIEPFCADMRVLSHVPSLERMSESNQIAWISSGDIRSFYHEGNGMKVDATRVTRVILHGSVKKSFVVSCKITGQ